MDQIAQLFHLGIFGKHMDLSVLLALRATFEDECSQGGDIVRPRKVPSSLRLSKRIKRNLTLRNFAKCSTLSLLVNLQTSGNYLVTFPTSIYYFFVAFRWGKVRVHLGYVSKFIDEPKGVFGFQKQ